MANRQAQVSLCECGCKQEVRFGSKFVKGHNSKLSLVTGKNSQWKGGRIVIDGYVYIYQPNHPNAMSGGYVAEHQLVLEEYLGRYLEKAKTRSLSEIPHHIDEDKQNNSIENLELCLGKTHTGFHNKQRHLKSL